MQLRLVTLKGINNPKDKKTCGILIDTARGEEWVNGWQSARTQALNKGETIKVWLYEEEYQGKKYLKFKLPSLDALMATGGEDRSAQQTAQAFNGTVVDQGMKSMAVEDQNVSNPVNEGEQGIRVEDISF